MEEEDIEEVFMFLEVVKKQAHERSFIFAKCQLRFLLPIVHHIFARASKIELRLCLTF